MHIRTYMINGSNHWVLHQPDQVNKIDLWPGDTKSYLWQPVITSPVIGQQQKSHRQLFSPLYWGSCVLMADVQRLAASIFSPSETVWFQQKQIEAESQSLTKCSICKMGFIHFTQCGASVIKGSNHQVSITSCR